MAPWLRVGLTIAAMLVTTVGSVVANWIRPPSGLRRRHAVLIVSVLGIIASILSVPGAVGAIQGKAGLTAQVRQYLNKMLRAPDGSAYYITSDGTRQAILNDLIVNCLKVRRGIGDPVELSTSEIDSYPGSGRTAFCPYSRGMNFITESGSNGYIYLVDPNGVKHHAGGYCVEHPDYPDTPPQFALYTVPTGELAGDILGADWFPNPAACQALPLPN